MQWSKLPKIGWRVLGQELQRIKKKERRPWKGVGDAQIIIFFLFWTYLAFTTSTTIKHLYIYIFLEFIFFFFEINLIWKKKYFLCIKEN